MKHLLLFLLAFSVGWYLQAQQNFKESKLTMAAEPGFLAASYISVKGKPRQIVLIIPGSGPTDRDGNSAMGFTNNSLKMVAESLAQNKIPSVRIDKRGIAGSKPGAIREDSLSFDHFVKDARSWIRLLTDSLGYKSVVVLGHSQGSLVGMLAAQDNDKVAGFISIAGIADQLGNTLRTQIAKQAPVLVDETEIILDSLEMGYTVNDVNPMLISLFRPSVQPFLISYMKYTPKEEIKKLTVPILIINGTTDIQVEVSDAEALHGTVPKSRLVVIDGMNHVLKESEGDLTSNMKTYNEPSLPLADGLMTAIVDYIKNLN